MDILPLNFRILQYCGIWYENPEQLWLVKTIYRMFVVIVLFSFTLSELIELGLISNNVHELTECLFVSLTFFTCCLKMVNFMCRQESLKVLLAAYRTEIFKPKTTEENKIITKYQDLISKFFLVYLSISFLAGLCIGLVPIINSTSNKTQLPVKSYQPYNTEGFTLYWLTYFHQVLCFQLGVFINISLDMLVCGLVVLICGQLDLCYHRISLNEVDSSKNDHVVHHILIGDIVNKVQSFFIVTVVLVFFFDLLVLCASLFQMPKQNIMTLEFFALFMYLSAILCQVFLYCWFGNELQLKSQIIADAIYKSNWADLTPHRRKDYLFSMFMSQNELKMSFHRQFSLSLHTFVWILKTSYGIFNLLQSTST